MRSLIRRLKKMKFFVIALVWLMWGFLLSAQAQTKPCGCADKANLLKRLRIAEMAMQEYLTQIESLKKKAEADGKAVPYSDKAYSDLIGSEIDAWRRVTETSDNDSIGILDPYTCSFKGLDDQSDCMQQISKSRLDFLRKRCLETLVLRGPKKSYVEEMQMIDIALESLFAFQEEQKLILKMLNSLPKNCRPNDWFGYVVYQRVDTIVGNVTKPPSTRAALGYNGGTEAQSLKETYVGTILVEDGKAVSRAYAAHSYSVVYTGSARVRCTSKEPIGTAVTTSNASRFLEGEANGNAEFSLDVYPGKRSYGISAYFFSVNMTGQMNFSTKTTAAGGCPSGEKSNNGSITMRSGDKQSGYSVSDEKLTSPDYLEGSRVVKLLPLNKTTTEQNSTLTQTNEIQFRWMLRRLPAK